MNWSTGYSGYVWPSDFGTGTVRRVAAEADKDLNQATSAEVTIQVKYSRFWERTWANDVCGLHKPAMMLISR